MARSVVVAVTGLCLGWLASGVGSGLSAQEDDECRSWGRDDASTHCEVREYTLAADGDLDIDGGPNGGISVEGWDRAEVLVRAKVRARADTDARAREIADQVDVDASSDRVEADGPDTRRRESWSVSYEVFVPRATDLDLETRNGGISIVEVSGQIRFRALNGGVTVSRLAGDVRGRTTNGGLHVELDGREWQGRGLDVETTNGGVSIAIPEGYSAELETGTVNGGLDLELPLRVRGRISRRIQTTLGDGGPLVRAVTTNGGVRVLRGA